MPFDTQEHVLYGCVFCRTGMEKVVARHMQEICPALRATPLEQIKHRKIDGKKSVEQKVLLPGYVFFQAEETSPPISNITRIEGVFRILKDSMGQWPLAGANLAFAKWVFEADGLIGLSTAHQDGDRIRIVEGPLKDFEGQVVKVDRRSRNGQVEFGFDGRTWRVWLAFEIVE